MTDQASLVEAKDAVERAGAYVADLYKDQQITNIMLEEIEFDSQNGVWRVTVSFSLRAQALPSQFGELAKILGNMRGPTVYKVISVDRTSGAILSMKMRETQQSA